MHDTYIVENVLFSLYGKEIVENIVEIDEVVDGIRIQGYISKPIIARNTRNEEIYFINNRYIKDKTISSAIDRACEEKYAINKHPFIVLNIYMNPSTIDVNVHPAKLEVKFSDEAKVFDNVYHAVRSALEKNSRENNPFTIARAELEKNNDSTEVESRIEIKDEEISEQEKQIEQISKDLINNGVIPSKKEKKYDFESSFNKLYAKPEVGEHSNINSLLESLNEKVGDINTNVEESVDNSTAISEEKLEENKEDESFEQAKFDVESYEENTIDNIEATYEYIGTVFDTYIIIRMKDKIYFVDQHAAHERYLFEQIKDAYYKKEQSTQMMLIPLLVGVSTKELDIVRNNMEMFEDAGFILEEFGENTIKISGVPNVGYNIDHKSMFKDIISELSGTEKTERQQKEWRFLATLACKAAVKGGTKLDVEEQKRLVDNMITLDNPFNCPHGRPTAIPFTRYEIERKFMRK